ncbi:OLC1v1013113C1 [Oldenlandia corymbosa var. corymbosa]|uniref:OLC1v1013113C1 n=1 Tax=Oldenlandia corymbosa var. corymbosa TaxID=529605 RepID=A0AAV1DZZ9_OLDCO|nr:OLC1v1013113C1 [Oldenlandia corymbosa var. corymbosa]
MAFHLRLRPSLFLGCPNFNVKSPVLCNKSYIGTRKLSGSRMFVCCSTPNDAHKLVARVKEKLQSEYNNLPAGKNGRDDEELILWFLRDRKFSVDDAVSKLTKAIRWYHAFGVSELSEQAVRSAAETGKAYVHDYLDTYDRPVLIVEVSKHLPGKLDISEDEKLCVYLVEKALSKLPDGKEQILGIIDLHGFSTENADLKFLSFLFDVFYYYYPRRLGEVLFVDAPFIFKPIWQLVKPMLRSYASLVKFCSAKTAINTYFTLETVPPSLRR